MKKGRGEKKVKKEKCKRETIMNEGGGGNGDKLDDGMKEEEKEEKMEAGMSEQNRVVNKGRKINRRGANDY